MFVFSDELIKKIGSTQHHHYCIITYGGKVISSGYNRPTGFTYNRKDYMRHAECDALLKLPFKYRDKKLRLYVIRKGYKNSKPCSKCLEFLAFFRIKNIYYSDMGCLWDEPFSTITNNHVSMKYLEE
jgi:tRNA(Arg) A34 adenosine deaminase TadA